MDRFETFTTLIAKISRNIRKIKSQVMCEYNLKVPHLSCLYFLFCADSLTVTELAERCEEDKATISRSVDYLERNGFIERKPRRERRYRAPIVLTEKGIVVGKAITEKINYVLDEVSKELPEKEREEFYKSLKIISDSLDAIVKNN